MPVPTQAIDVMSLTMMALVIIIIITRSIIESEIKLVNLFTQCMFCKSAVRMNLEIGK